MPREIADSDAESDLDSPPRPSASPIPENVVEAQPSTLEQDPWANLEFDQFLSPTQRLSSALERQDALQNRSLSSTDRFLQDIAQVDEDFLNSFEYKQGFDGSLDHRAGATPRGKTKRTITEIEYGSSKVKHDNQAQQRPIKRAKTYGNPRSQQSDDDFLFSSASDRGHQQAQGLNKECTENQSESTSNGLPVQQLVGPNSVGASKSSNLVSTSGRPQVYYQQGSTSFHSGNIHNTSVTKSFMGGYQGINLDFRGANLGLEVGANPFGSLSQVSLDNDANQTQTEKFASLFQHSQQSLYDDVAGEKIDPSTALRRGHLKEMATSPLRTTDTDPKMTHFGHFKNSVNDADLSSEFVSTTASNHILPEGKQQGGKSTEPTPKKRGRKSKHGQVDVQIAVPDVGITQQPQHDDLSDLPSEQYKPHPSRSRAGTVESVQSMSLQGSQGSEEVANATRKRKKSTLPESAVSDKSKQLSSELNLSDPAMIGAPKEMYVPRPSKSRSKRVVDDEDELQKAENPVPVQRHIQAAESPPSASTKKKPGRKSKVKRAKTSAAALIKSVEMYDEDDKDCILVDEMPAKVKMAPLPKISSVKQEVVDLDLDGEQEKHSSHETKGNETVSEPQAEVKISVDIPKPPKTDASESSVTKSEPKKRGRKPKKKAEEQVQAIADGEAEEGGQKSYEEATTTTELSNDRTILSEKDLNITSLSNPPSEPQSPLPSPKKPVHSPLKPKLSSTPAPSTRESTPTGALWSKPRIGLSRRTAIPSLLRKLDRSKEPPKVIERKEKLSKRQQEEQDKRRLEAEDAGEAYVDRWEVRGKDGMLLEWDE